MIGVDATFLVALIGWSIFAPFAALVAGWWARGGEQPHGGFGR